MDYDAARSYLEEHFGQTEESRQERDKLLVESQFDDLVQRSMCERLAQIHGVPLDREAIEARKRARQKKPKSDTASNNKQKVVNGVPIPRTKPGPSKPAKPRKNLAWLPKECRALVKIQ